MREGPRRGPSSFRGRAGRFFGLGPGATRPALGAAAARWHSGAIANLGGREMATTGGTKAGERPAGRRGAPRSTVFAWMVIVLGLVPLGFGLWGLKQGLETLRWPKVEAEIVDKKLILRDDTPSHGGVQVGHVRIRERTEFAAFAVLFRYTFAGETRLGAGVERGDLGLQNSAKSRELDDAHPIGSKAMVVVDPNDPDDAYLLAGPSSAAKMLSGVGAGMVLIGLWMRSLMRRGIGSGRPVGETD